MLDEFGEISRLQVNLLKSNIYIARMNESIKQQLFFIIDFQERVMPFEYLGIPLAFERLKITNYDLLLDSLILRINSWLKQTLSYARKT